MVKMNDNKMQPEDSNSFQMGRIGTRWTGKQLIEWLQFEDKIKPPIARLLPYGQGLMPEYNGLFDYEDLMFLYINKDIWGF